MITTLGWKLGITEGEGEIYDHLNEHKILRFDNEEDIHRNSQNDGECGPNLYLDLLTISHSLCVTCILEEVGLTKKKQLLKTHLPFFSFIIFPSFGFTLVYGQQSSPNTKFYGMDELIRMRLRSG